MSLRRLVFSLAVAAPLALTACGDDDEGSSASTTPSGGGLTVVATTTITGDLVRHVAGERAEVVTLLPVNADPHDYEPRPSDAKSVAEAGLVIRSGGEIDEWLGGIIENAGGDATEVELIDAVKTREGGHDREDGDEHAGEEEKHAEDGIDAHWWQDPANAVLAVKAIRAALVEADPEGVETYNANAQAYTAELETLDQAIASCMRDIPAEQRKLVTNHDAFGYLADRFDIEVVGTVIPGLSTQSQASAGEVTELVKTIEREKVTTIFPENTVNQRLERAIAEQAGATVGPALWSDSIGEPGSSGATYADMMRFNAGALASGFTGSPNACDLG